jgi:photosystem II stability/assembly factor-like uncharacterized protein
VESASYSDCASPTVEDLQKVSDNVYVIIGDGGNVAVMPTSEGVILVDDKFAQDAPEIMAKVKSVSDKPIRELSQ